MNLEGTRNAFGLCVNDHEFLDETISHTETLFLGMALATFQEQHHVKLNVVSNWDMNPLYLQNDEDWDYMVVCPDDASAILFKMQFQSYIDHHLANILKRKERIAEAEARRLCLEEQKYLAERSRDLKRSTLNKKIRQFARYIWKICYGS